MNMEKKMKLKSKLAHVCVTTLLLLATQLTFAADRLDLPLPAKKGGVGDAGANGYGFNLLDLVLTDRVTQRTTEEVLKSNRLIVELMQKLDQVAYKFSANFTNDKKWLFIKGFNKDVSQGCVNFSAIQYVDQQQVVRACQFPTKYILVDEDWFEDARNSDVVRSALITHEIFVGKAQSNGLYKEETKRTVELDIQLNNGLMFKLFRQGQMTLAALQSITTESGLMHASAQLITPERAENLYAYIWENGPKVCESIKTQKEQKTVIQSELNSSQQTALEFLADAVRAIDKSSTATSGLELHFSKGTYRILNSMTSRVLDREILKYLSETTSEFCEKMKSRTQ